MRRKTFYFRAIGLLFAAFIVSVFVIFRFQELRWRAQVVVLVAGGQVPDLSLSEALWMIRPNSGYWLEGLVESHNPYVSISNPYATQADSMAGAQIFGGNCAACHGIGARGGTAPALIGRELTHGDSDWAIYRTIHDGVRGTSMPPHPWPEQRVWQAISYVRSIETAKALPVSVNTEPPRVVDAHVSYDELQALEEPGKDWLAYSGSYSGARHSTLAQIDRSNVMRLAPRWIYQFTDIGDRIELSPLVRNGVMFVTYAGKVTALDARNGEKIWEFARTPAPDARACCGNVNRGLAILDDRLFVGTTDARIVALSVNTGKKLWETPVVSDYRPGYSITSAPLAYRGLVVTGISGGDYPTRGFIVALDAATGKERWRFWTIPGPGEAGHETWAGDSWKVGGGSTWLTGSYDPKLDILYWGTANPAPDFNSAPRKGDNLYTNSVVALRGTTGQKLWYFQFSPGDDHDWDSAQIPVIANRPNAAAPRQLLWANRNGFFYALNRETGKFLAGAPYVHQTWAKGLDVRGRPIPNPGAAPSPRGTIVFPGVEGATNWWTPSYDPELDLMIVPVLEHGGIFFSSSDEWAPKPGELYLAGATGAAPGQPHYTGVVALNPNTGSIVWQYRRPPSVNEDLHLGGLTSTRGALVFASDDELFYALDSRTGDLLWSFPTGARIAASPITFEDEGTQYVLVASGRTLVAFALVDSQRQVTSR